MSGAKIRPPILAPICAQTPKPKNTASRCWRRLLKVNNQEAGPQYKQFCIHFYVTLGQNN